MSYKSECSAIPHSSSESNSDPTLKCDFKKSKLFCTTENGGQSVFTRPGVISPRTVASLEVCQKNCSEVLHDVCGVFSVVAASLDVPFTTPLLFNVTFRIIDEFGEEVCQRTFNVAKNVTAPVNTLLTIDFPFCFNCCDTPLQCEANTTYRLQVSGETTSQLILFGAAFVRDITWAAIVWEA